ncbi:hypothetical protein LOZ86_00645 [Pectobacterium parvum]|uniref:hypothetical protein n=1 Tax=Pectobacterium parvum TaxID=2778550 RepID=UPI00103B3EAD|nr:hypothetical protein [Pectobacterium parvum]UFK39468.1 hypothetical protein LOZ86_00645 [Pectobacterium parvum]
MSDVKMNISTYVKAHLFNSSNAAVKLAEKNKNHRHQCFAEKLILKKINKITSTNETYNVGKSIKYNEIIEHLNKTSPFPSKLNILLDSNIHAGKNDCRDDMNKFMRSPQHISDMKKGIVDAGNKVTNDENINTGGIRRIVTNLTCLTLVNEEKLASDSTRFLEEYITDKDKFRCFGNEKNYDYETLQKVKDHINKIKEWANNLNYK